ncbi:MAG: hypothetical protein HND47_04695 [Chloroflexi bacterium]|nr:hypothetical protein [Chloroflexota bacterium]
MPGPTRQFVGLETLISTVSGMAVGTSAPGGRVSDAVIMGAGVSVSVTARSVGRISVGVKVRVNVGSAPGGGPAPHPGSNRR